MKERNLDNLKMTVVETDPAGVVDKETEFVFAQTGNLVSASYAGGKILKGFLVGTLKFDKLSFAYCQLQPDGKMDTGHSLCVISLTAEGKIQMTEHFEWKSRPGVSGINVFLER